MPELVMPRLSDSMEEGVVLAWLKSVGDPVEIGEELVEIETDKANMVYESDLAGTLLEIIAEEGAVVPIGGAIARIGEPGEEEQAGSGAGEGGAGAGGPAEEGGDGNPAHSPSQASAQNVRGDTDTAAAETAQADGGGAAEDAPETVSEATREEQVSGAGAAVDAGRVKASPLARRLAKEKGLDLAGITGSGPGGRIIKRDIEQAETDGRREPAAAPAAPARGDAVLTAKGDVEIVELNRLQQTIARRMAESKATAPHFYLTTEIDMSACVAGRAALKKNAGEGDVVPSFNDMVVKACALALRDHPKANGSYKDGQIELHSRINVGVAVAAPGALVVPTIFDADRKGLVEIAQATRELAAKVRDQSITPPELSGGTFSVSNLGMYGITEFDAVVNTPQAAILAVGAIVERPVARNGEVTTAHMMSVTLSWPRCARSSSSRWHWLSSRSGRSRYRFGRCQHLSSLAFAGATAQNVRTDADTAPN